MKIFLTGQKGMVGSNLLMELNNSNHDVLTDIRYFDNTKFDVVIHLAATTSISTEFNPLIFENNIVFAKKIMSTPHRLIFASSCSAKYNTNPYAASKIYNEFLGSIHPNALGLRFHNIYGKNASRGIVWWLMQQPDGAKITIRGPELVRDYIHVDDVVNEIIKNLPSYKEEMVNVNRNCGKNCRPIMRPKLVHNKGVFDVGTGVGRSTLELVQLYRKLSGKHFELEFAPAGSNEPEKMVANISVPNFITLEEGLKKLLNQP